MTGTTEAKASGARSGPVVAAAATRLEGRLPELRCPRDGRLLAYLRLTPGSVVALKCPKCGGRYIVQGG